MLSRSCVTSLRYVCIVQKAYQDTDSVVSTVTTKVKGYAVINGSAHTPSPQFRDVADYVIPPQVHGLLKDNVHFKTQPLLALFMLLIQFRAQC